MLCVPFSPADYYILALLYTLVVRFLLLPGKKGWMSSKINTIIHNTGQRRRPLTLCSYHIKRSGGLCVCVQCLHKFVHDKLLMNTLHSSSCVWGDTRCLFACFVSKHLIIHSHKKKQSWVKNVCFWTHPGSRKLSPVVRDEKVYNERWREKIACFCAITTKEEGEMLTNGFQIENMAWPAFQNGPKVLPRAEEWKVRLHQAYMYAFAGKFWLIS